MRIQKCSTARDAAREAIESGAEQVAWDVECCSICREAGRLYCADMVAIEAPEESLPLQSLQILSDNIS